MIGWNICSRYREQSGSTFYFAYARGWSYFSSFSSSSSSSTGPRWLLPPDVLQPRRFILRARLWKFPLVPPGVPTPKTTRQTSSRERGNYGREMSGEFCRQIASFTLFEGLFYIPQISDLRPTDLLPLRRKACWGFFSPARFEPANLGTRGQHANS
jgi:hypothetical protein